MDEVSLLSLILSFGHILQLSEVILSIVSMMMDVDRKTLADAQLHDKACTRQVPFTRRDSVCDKVIFFLMQAMGSIATNGSVHKDICVSDFYCNEHLNGEVSFDTVADAPCEWTIPARKILFNATFTSIMNRVSRLDKVMYTAC